MNSENDVVAQIRKFRLENNINAARGIGRYDRLKRELNYRLREKRMLKGKSEERLPALKENLSVIDLGAESSKKTTRNMPCYSALQHIKLPKQGSLPKFSLQALLSEESPRQIAYHYSGMQEHKILSYDQTCSKECSELIHMIHQLDIEYRNLDILRVRFLHQIEQLKGHIPVDEFLKLLRCIIKNTSKEFEDFFVKITKAKDGTISYSKLCEVISQYQYQQRIRTRPRETKLRPYESNISNSGRLDTIIDYIWCRLSEKYIRMSKAFRNFDLSIRGKINFHEFKFGLENLHIRLQKSELIELFKLLDKNHDGFLSFEEFTLLSKGNAAEIRDPMKSLSRLQNSPGSRIENRRLLPIPKKNLSAVGELMAGRKADYHKLENESLTYPWEETKIYPVEKGLRFSAQPQLLKVSHHPYNTQIMLKGTKSKSRLRQSLKPCCSLLPSQHPKD